MFFKLHFTRPWEHFEENFVSEKSVSLDHFCTKSEMCLFLKTSYFFCLGTLWEKFSAFFAFFSQRRRPNCVLRVSWNIFENINFFLKKKWKKIVFQSFSDTDRKNSSFLEKKVSEVLSGLHSRSPWHFLRNFFLRRVLFSISFLLFERNFVGFLSNFVRRRSQNCILQVQMTFSSRIVDLKEEIFIFFSTLS